MAEFLPFIRQDSSPITILKAVIVFDLKSQYSVVKDLYAVIVRLGVESVRKTMITYSPELDIQEKVRSLAALCPNLHMSHEQGNYWEHVLSHINKYNTRKDYNSLNLEEELILVTTIAHNTPELLGDLGFKLDMLNFMCYAFKDVEFPVKNLKYVKLSDTAALRVGFSSYMEFRAYIASKEVCEQDVHITPVHIPTVFSVVTQEEGSCVSPYGDT